MSIITMLCPPDLGINKDRAVKLALIHDMAEALVGDITPPDNIDKDVKHKRELDSMNYICDELLTPISPQIAGEFMELWLEYEEGTTPEAVFVKDGMFGGISGAAVTVASTAGGGSGNPTTGETAETTRRGSWGFPGHRQ